MILAKWKTLYTKNNSLTIGTRRRRRRRRLGRPLKRLLDGYERESETGRLLA
jgi:hypothetical protein